MPRTPQRVGIDLRDLRCRFAHGAAGALIAGTVADALGYGGAIAIVAGLTAASGLWVLRDMPTERRGGVSSVPPWATPVGVPVRETRV